jgi:Uma2 family endonuclease
MDANSREWEWAGLRCEAGESGATAYTEPDTDTEPPREESMQTMPRLYRWTRAEYERLGDLGFFDEARVELVGGKIVEMSPKRPRHSLTAGLTYEVLVAAFRTVDCHVRKEDPLALGEWDAPEPDVAVVAGARRAFGTAYPTAAQTLLVIEVAETTVAYDLGDKADEYAAAGIVDYWVINIPAGLVVVLRAPQHDRASETGIRYGDRHEYRRGEQITPLAAGAAPVAVADLLP